MAESSTAAQSTPGIELLQASAPYELGSMGALYPTNIRGETYLAAHKGGEATAEFQKILEDR